MGSTFTVGVIITAVIMLAALIGMIICAKKQNVVPVAKPVAIILMLVVIICAVVILIKTGVVGDQGVKRIMRNEMVFAKASTYILGKHLGEKYPGSIALLLVDYQTEANVRQKEMIASLKEGLGNKITVAAVETPAIVKLGEETAEPSAPAAEQEMLPEEMMGSLTEMLKAQDFDAAIRKFPACNMIISLIGLPVDVEEMEIWQLEPDKRPKVAIANASCHNLKTAIQSGAVVAAVGYHPKAEFNEKPAPKNAQKAFDKRYILITPENVDKLSSDFPGMLFEEAGDKK